MFMSGNYSATLNNYDRACRRDAAGDLHRRQLSLARAVLQRMSSQQFGIRPGRYTPLSARFALTPQKHRASQ
jgi:hypothetical protein